ncbi:MAG: hypothetical protein ACR2QG_00655 [Gammaproteobacteria bacterium]
MRLINTAVRFTVLTFVFIAAVVSISGLTLTSNLVKQPVTAKPAHERPPAATPNTLHAERVEINNQETS